MRYRTARRKKCAYDLVGNRLKKESAQGTEIYFYNPKNQLTHRQSGPDTLRYLYDRQGNLLVAKYLQTEWQAVLVEGL